MMSDVPYNVYFSCSMTGQPEELRQGNLNFGKRLKQVCSELDLTLFDPEEKDQQGGFPEGQIFEGERVIVEQCKLMVMLLDQPSCGAGGEAVMCYYFKIPIILVSRDISKVSKFVLDNPLVKEYITFHGENGTMEEIKQAIAALLSIEERLVTA